LLELMIKKLTKISIKKVNICKKLP